MDQENIKKAKLRDLKIALDEADASGEPVPLDVEKIISEAKKRRAERKPETPPQPTNYQNIMSF